MNRALAQALEQARASVKDLTAAEAAAGLLATKLAVSNMQFFLSASKRRQESAAAADMIKFSFESSLVQVTISVSGKVKFD